MANADSKVSPSASENHQNWFIALHLFGCVALLLQFAEHQNLFGFFGRFPSSRRQLRYGRDTDQVYAYETNSSPKPSGRNEQQRSRFRSTTANRSVCSQRFVLGFNGELVLKNAVAVTHPFFRVLGKPGPIATPPRSHGNRLKPLATSLFSLLQMAPAPA